MVRDAFYAKCKELVSEAQRIICLGEDEWGGCARTCDKARRVVPDEVAKRAGYVLDRRHGTIRNAGSRKTSRKHGLQWTSERWSSWTQRQHESVELCNSVTDSRYSLRVDECDLLMLLVAIGSVCSGKIIWRPANAYNRFWCFHWWFWIVMLQMQRDVGDAFRPR